MKKIIIFILSAIMLMSCVACKKTNEHNSSNGSSVAVKSDEKITNRYILKNGNTDYKIVIPEQAGEYLSMARDELTSLFFEATGVMLTCVTDSGLSYNDQAKYLSLGNTTVFENASIEVASEVKGKGAFQITTKGNSIFFIGELEHGVLFGVYEWLFRILNFEQFSYDCYTLDKAVTDIPLYEYSVVDAPDYPNYMAFTNYMQYDKTVRLRMKGVNNYDLQGLIGGVPTHNTLKCIDPSVYNNPDDPANYHPEWYNHPDKTQLCYMAQGNEESRQLLITTFAEEVIKCIQEQPTKHIWQIAGMDDHRYCQCDVCNQLRADYGCNSAQGIWFTNAVYDYIMEWFETDEGKPYYSEEFRMEYEFYEAYVDAPAEYNEETQQWQPIVIPKYEEKYGPVVLQKGIYGMCAPIFANWQVPLTDPVNVIYYEQIMKVKACSHELDLWLYASNFGGNALFPFDNYSSMQANYQFLYEIGTRMMMDETQNGQPGGMTGFHMLKSYLSNQIAWDVYVDQNELIDRFFDGYFLDASEDMRKFFESYLNFSQLQMNGLCPGIGGYVYPINKKEYWPKPVIDTWQGYVDDALLKIEKYKTIDMETYDMLYKHITMERVFLDYVYLQHYVKKGDALFPMVRDRFAEGVRLNKIHAFRYGTLIEPYIQSLYQD